MSMAIYRGYGGQNGTRVTVERDGIEVDLRHYVRHSPSGFSWGYEGSGPAELARCILIDHYDLHVLSDARGLGIELPVSYQDFKRDVIARLADWMDTQRFPPSTPVWELTNVEIYDWIRAREPVA